MKNLDKLFLLTALCAWSVNCPAQGTRYDNDIVVIADVTDRMASTPTSGEIISQLGLKDNPYQSVRITVTCISDRDINYIKVLTLDAENKWTGNQALRKAKISHLERQLAQCLNEVKYAGPLPYSIVYRTISRQANQLAASGANRQLLLVYSDLYEKNEALNFYDPQTLARVRKDPDGIGRQLAATAPIRSLKDVQVWLIYNPATFAQNNGYMAIAGLYKRLLESRGATVHIGNKFIVQ